LGDPLPPSASWLGILLIDIPFDFIYRKTQIPIEKQNHVCCEELIKDAPKVSQHKGGFGKG
jgi:hypothetical protein